MMDSHTQIGAPQFPGNGKALVTPTRAAALSLTRYAPTDIGDGLRITMPPEDAWVIVYQLREHPAHDFWMDGKFMPADPAPRGTLNIVDLTADPRAESTKPIDKLMFHIPRAAIDEAAAASGATPIGCLRAPQGWLTHDPVVGQFETFLLSALDGRETNRLLIDHVLLGLNAHFACAYGGLAPGKSVSRGGLAAWQERRAKDLLESRLSGDLSLQELASECGLSASHFSRAFKASTGVTPSAWLQQRRLEAALRLLHSSFMPLATIALACGFADQSHLTRAFKQSYGVPPGEWRRRYS